MVVLKFWMNDVGSIADKNLTKHLTNWIDKILTKLLIVN